MIKASNDISIKSFLTDIKIISIIYFVFLIAVVCIFGYTPNNDTEGYIEYAQICLHNNQPYPCTSTIVGQPFIWNIGIINLVEFSIYPKSVIRISLCRTAKRNPLIFPI